jgi:hypothetical protein
MLLEKGNTWALPRSDDLDVLTFIKNAMLSHVGAY